MSVRLCGAVKAIRDRRVVLLTAALCALMTGIPASIATAGGLPRNPQRPFTAQSCEAAKARLTEAEAGSALIAAREMAQVIKAAERQAERLCPPVPAPVPGN